MENNFCGIYEIINKANGKKYGGSTTDFRRRRRKHFLDLRRNIHTNKHLQVAWNKYGEENFQFRSVIHCEGETEASTFGQKT